MKSELRVTLETVDWLLLSLFIVAEVPFIERADWSMQENYNRCISCYYNLTISWFMWRYLYGWRWLMFFVMILRHERREQKNRLATMVRELWQSQDNNIRCVGTNWLGSCYMYWNHNLLFATIFAGCCCFALMQLCLHYDCDSTFHGTTNPSYSISFLSAVNRGSRMRLSECVSLCAKLSLLRQSTKWKKNVQCCSRCNEQQQRRRPNDWVS